MNSIFSCRKYQRSLIRITTVCLAFSVIDCQVQAELLTTSEGLPATGIIDFSQFASIDLIVFEAGDPSIEIDELPNETVLLNPVSGISAVAIILGDHDYSLGPHGVWGAGREGYLGIGGG